MFQSKYIQMNSEEEKNQSGLNVFEIGWWIPHVAFGTLSGIAGYFDLLANKRPILLILGIFTYIYMEAPTVLIKIYAVIIVSLCENRSYIYFGIKVF